MLIDAVITDIASDAFISTALGPKRNGKVGGIRIERMTQKKNVKLLATFDSVNCVNV